MLNELELTILALVAEGPRYAAEIEQMIDDRGLYEWLTVGSSSVPYVLKKLEGQKLLSARAGDDNPTLIYAITEAGKGVLQTAVAHLLRQPRPLGTGIDLGLANLKVLKPALVYQVLVQRRASMRQQLESTEHIWQRHQQEGRSADDIRAHYTHAITMITAELAWLDSFIEDWARRYPAATPERAPDDLNVTRIHRRTEPLDPAKLAQQLKRPKTAE